MNDFQIAAGLFALAKSHRRVAHDYRVMANKAAQTMRADGMPELVKAGVLRKRAAREDDRAAYLHRAASLARVGACTMALDRLAREYMESELENRPERTPEEILADCRAALTAPCDAASWPPGMAITREQIEAMGSEKFNLLYMQEWPSK